MFLRERVQVVHVRARDLEAGPADPPDGGADRAVGRAPAEHERPRIPVRVVDLELRDVGRDVRDLLRAQPHHLLVVVGVVRDRARHVFLLEPADPVLQARRARYRPRPRERDGIALVGMEELAVVRLGGEVGRDRGQCRDVRDQPRLRAVRERGVREQVDRRAVLERDARGLDRGVEALRRARCGDDRHRALAVAAVEDHQQVGLLWLRRHPGRRPGPLDVEDEERQLEHHRETDRLGLEHDPRSRRGRDTEGAAERRAERGTARRDLVLGLERRHSEVLLLSELLEDRGRRRDRVGAEEERQARQLRRGDEPVAHARCCP